MKQGGVPFSGSISFDSIIRPIPNCKKEIPDKILTNGFSRETNCDIKDGPGDILKTNKTSYDIHQ